MMRCRNKKIFVVTLLVAAFLSIQQNVHALLYQDISAFELRQRMEDLSDDG